MQKSVSNAVRAALITAAAALIALGAMPAVAGPSPTPTKLWGTQRRSEEFASLAPGYFASDQRNRGERLRWGSVLVAPDGGSPVRVNEDETNGRYPSLDVGNAHLGDVLLFSQWRGHGQMDVKVYDLVSGTLGEPPAGVNTSASEIRPSISGDHILFGRGPADKPARRAILYDLTTGTSETLTEANYVWPGLVNGDWVVYQACTQRCTIWRYQISTDDYTRVPTPRKWNYFPVIDDDGTVYFGNSGWDCGLNVRLMKHTPGAASSTVARRFPAGVDIFPSDVVDHEPIFGRYDCSREEGDIYRLSG